jgi:ribonuclease Z
MARELVVLGSASQAPTRFRNHNGYFLRWDAEGLLFDPGEGTQRQMVIAGVSAAQITRIFITHFHGDHCLGLPGVLARLALDQVTRPVDVYYPAAGQEFFDRLREACATRRRPELRPHPVAADGVVEVTEAFTIISARLDHSTEAFGWRLVEPDGRRMLPDRLEAAGIRGPDVGRLLRDGSLGGISLEDMSERRPGQKMAFVMDTRWCDAARDLAEGVDLLVCESTFLEAEADLAESYGHLTAAQAARLARDAGVRRLVLTHFSQRHPDEQVYAAEARPVFPGAVVVRDLDVVSLPRRRRGT